MKRRLAKSIAAPDLATYEELVELWKTGQLLGDYAIKASDLLSDYTAHHPELPLLGEIHSAAQRENDFRSNAVTAAAELDKDEGAARPLDRLIEMLCAGVDSEVRGILDIPKEVADKLGIAEGQRSTIDVAGDLVRLVGEPIVSSYGSLLANGLPSRETWERLHDIFLKRRTARLHLIPKATQGSFLLATYKALESLVSMEKGLAQRWWQGPPGTNPGAYQVALQSLTTALQDPTAPERLGWAGVSLHLQSFLEHRPFQRALLREIEAKATQLGRYSARSEGTEWLQAEGALWKVVGDWKAHIAGVRHEAERLALCLLDIRTVPPCELCAVPSNLKVPGFEVITSDFLGRCWDKALDHGRRLDAWDEEIRRLHENLGASEALLPPPLPKARGDWSAWFAAANQTLTELFRRCGTPDPATLASSTLARSRQDQAAWQVRKDIPREVVLLIDEDASWPDIVSQTGELQPSLAKGLHDLGVALENSHDLAALSVALQNIQAGQRSLAYLVTQHPNAQNRFAQQVLMECLSADGPRSRDPWWVDVFQLDAPRWRALMAWAFDVRQAPKKAEICEALRPIEEVRPAAPHDAHRVLDRLAEEPFSCDDFPSAFRPDVKVVVENLKASIQAHMANVGVRIAVIASLYQVHTVERLPPPIWRERMHVWPQHLEGRWLIAGEAADRFYDLCRALSQDARKLANSSDISLLRAKSSIHFSPSYLARKDDAPSMEEIHRAATDLIHALDGLSGTQPSGAAPHLTQRVCQQLRSLGLDLLALGLPHAAEGAALVSTILLQVLPALASGDEVTLESAKLVKMKVDDAHWLRSLVDRYVRDEPTISRAREVLGSPRGEDVREATRLLEAIIQRLGPMRPESAQGVGNLVWACHELPLLPQSPPPSTLASYLTATVRLLHRPLFYHFQQTASAELRDRALHTADPRLGDSRGILRLLQDVQPNDSTCRALLQFLNSNTD